MTKNSWRRFFAHKLDEAEALSKLPSHQKYTDTFDDYDGRISIDGEEYNTDSLRYAYITACEDVCDSAVIDFLTSVDDPDVEDEMLRNIFVPMAYAQRVKSRFVKALEREERAKSCTIGISDKLSQDAVSHALSQLSVKVRLNLATKKIEFYGCDSLYELYSRSNILSIMPSVILDKLKNEGITGLGSGTKMIEQYLFNLADINRYNPIHDMLEEYDNDDEGYFDTVCAMLDISSDYHRTLLRKWLIQCVALAYNTVENNTPAEGVLVLQGKQGSGKTSFFRRLALKSEWFSEGAVIDIKNKDTVISAVGTWICELGEIDSTLKREQSALKSFITRPLDRIRFPYAAAESELARTTSMCGTVNPEQFLNDTTGSRRYWVISVGEIDKEFLFGADDEFFKQLWGWVYHTYKENPEGFRLTDDERKMLESKNTEYSCELKYEAEVMELLDFSIDKKYWKEVRPAQLARFIGNVSAVQVGRILKKLSDSNEDIERKKCREYVLYKLPLRKDLVNNM